MWIVIGLGLFVLAALFLIAVALHDDVEQTGMAMLVFGFLSFVGTIVFSALNDWTIPSKAALVESAKGGLILAFAMAGVGLLALIVSAPIRMISRAIANRNCPTCAQYHDHLHRPSSSACPECVEYHKQDHDSEGEDFEYEEESL